MSRRVTSRHVASCRIIITSFHVILRHVTSCHVMSRHSTSCHVMYLMSRHATPCHVMPYHVMSRHVKSCHVTSCHVLPRHVTSCYVISRRKSRNGHTTNASLSTDFFHTKSIQIKHDRVRWLSRRLPIPYRISGIWSSCVFVLFFRINSNISHFFLPTNQFSFWPVIRNTTLFLFGIYSPHSISL